MWPVHVGMQMTACFLWHRAFTNWAMCCLGAWGQHSNSVVLVWWCVFCLERRAVIKPTFCWVKCCQALKHTHTHTTLTCLRLVLASHSCHFFFLTGGISSRSGPVLVPAPVLGEPQGQPWHRAWSVLASTHPWVDVTLLLLANKSVTYN